MEQIRIGAAKMPAQVAVRDGAGLEVAHGDLQPDGTYRFEDLPTDKLGVLKVDPIVIEWD